VELFVVYIDPDLQAEYQGAWLAWEKQLKVLHEVFLDGGSLDPPRLKGLLNREARAKVRYDTARLALLGIPAGAGPPESESPTIRPPGPPR
jgi:hypothetical protein